MTSIPLFIKVEESIVTLGPIVHVGWRNAWLIVTCFNCSEVYVRKGPPDVVRIILLTAEIFSPLRHWNIALCSLSMGIKATPCLRASVVTYAPPETKASL